MKIGNQIVVTETALVYDEHGQDLLLAGAEGTISGMDGDLLSVRTAKGVYDSIPVSCVRLKTEKQPLEFTQRGGSSQCPIIVKCT